MKKSKLLLVTILTMVISILFSANVFAGSADWGTGDITAEGYGAAPLTARTPGQAKALARRAAIVDAYRNLGEFVEGIRVDSETSVKDMVVESDVIKTKMSALVKGAVVTSEQANSDGSYQIVLKIPMYGGGNSLAGAVLPNPGVVEPFPTPVMPNLPVPSAPSNPAVRPTAPMVGGGYTGLIVDCRGLGLQRAMSPVVLDNNEKPIYGHKNLDYSKVISRGMASYSADGVSDLSRAGSNPLVVKAVCLAGNDCNPVISVEDANRVLLENQSTAFLGECAVVFIE